MEEGHFHSTLQSRDLIGVVIRPICLFCHIDWNENRLMSAVIFVVDLIEYMERSEIWFPILPINILLVSKANLLVPQSRKISCMIHFQCIWRKINRYIDWNENRLMSAVIFVVDLIEYMERSSKYYKSPEKESRHIYNTY
jgi:hypothetical protein